MKRRGGKPVALGIIGTGEIVRMISGALRGCKEIEVRAIAGTRMSAAEELAATFPGAEAFSDYRPLLQIDEVEAVYIATPPKLHFEMLLSALEAGKHVICEKPLVVSPDELEAVDVVSSGHPGILVASCSSRFQVCPPVRRARSLIAEGSLGRLSHVRLHHSIEPPAPLSSLPRWKQNAATSGGGLCLDWGVYDLDWLQFVLGSAFDPVAVTAQLDRTGYADAGLETGYGATIVCRNGLTISLERRPEQGPRFQRAEIRGTAAGLDLPFMPGTDASAFTRFVQAGSEVVRENLAEVMCGWSPILEFPVFDLANAIIEERPPASPLSAQRLIHRTIAAIYDSATTGRTSVLAELGKFERS